MKDIFCNIPKVTLKDDSDLRKLQNGINLFFNDYINYDGLCNIYFKSNFIGIGALNKGICKRKVLL